MRQVPQGDNFPAAPRLDGDTAEQSRAAMKGLASLVERVTPWLFSVGSWIFGGLTAFGLVVMSALLTVGPADRAILISITAFACALPLNVSGILLLRLVADIKDTRLDDLALRAFRDAKFPRIEAHFPASADGQSRYKRMSNVALAYSLAAAGLGLVLTLVGLVSALWHMAWWIGVVLIVMIIVCASVSVFVIGVSLSPASEAEKELK